MQKIRLGAYNFLLFNILSFPRLSHETSMNLKKPSRVARAKEVISTEAKTLARLIERIDPSFENAVQLTLDCSGLVVVTGMGKAGIIGQKISATFASTGTPSIFLHPAEAAHGDLGRVRENDLLLALSNSGQTEEILRLLSAVKKIGAKIISITGNPASPLAKHSDCILNMGQVDEACPLGLAPTASTTALLAMGDALAMVVADEREFSREKFALYHPAGSLGRSLMKVEEVMRKGENLPLVTEEKPLAEVLQAYSATPGRPGAAIVVDSKNKLKGFFSDGDLRRILGRENTDALLRTPIREVMTVNPKTIESHHLASEALNICKTNKIDQLVVVDAERNVVGLLDVQDLLEIRI